MLFNIEIVEKGTGEVVESMYNVETKVMEKLRVAYALDPFYSIRISN